MADASPATVTVTLRPVPSVETLRAAMRLMDNNRRNRVQILLRELAGGKLGK